MDERKVVRIEIEFEDGDIERATGEDATQIWKAIEQGFVFKHLHGLPYTGPKMQPVPKP